MAMIMGSSSTTGIRRVPVTGTRSCASRLRSLPQSSHQPLHSPPGHQAEGLDHDERGHLRLAFHPVDEPDGHLPHRSPCPLGLVGHLDLESIAVGPDPIELDAAEHRGRVGPEPRGRIGHPESEQGGGIDVAPPGEEAPVPRPVGDGAPWDVPRPHGQLTIWGQRPNECRERLRLVGEVGVHLHTDVEIASPVPSGNPPGRRCRGRTSRAGA